MLSPQEKAALHVKSRFLPAELARGSWGRGRGPVGFEPRQQDCVEEAVAPFALTGEYRVLVKHISGDIVGKRARLTIVRHAGTPRESKQVQTIPLSQEDQTVRVLLKGGRLTEPLAVPMPPASAKRIPSDRRRAFSRVPAGGNPRIPEVGSAGAVTALELGPGTALSHMASALFRDGRVRAVEEFRTLAGLRTWLQRAMG